MSSYIKNISLVAIGSELTSGEVINSNVSWLSAQLSDLGIETPCHVTVSDHREDIKKALDFAASFSSHIIVTGGLGPTSDDFTRHVISDYLGQELTWSEDAWGHVCHRLNSLNVAVTENNKQQCFFPKDSTLLKNSAGTAYGFIAKNHKVEIIALPGPPHEIKTIWETSLGNCLAARVSSSQRKLTKKFTVLGYSESKFASELDEILPQADFEYGYRARMPYVDFKVGYHAENSIEALRLFESIRSRFGKIIIGEDNFDILQKIIPSIRALDIKKIVIIDSLTRGKILNRISASPIADLVSYYAIRQKDLSETYLQHVEPTKERNLVIGIDGNSDSGLLTCDFSFQTTKDSLRTETNYKSHSFRERLERYATEWILFRTCEFIGSLLNNIQPTK